jgi:hypothetical protein
MTVDAGLLNATVLLLPKGLVRLDMPGMLLEAVKLFGRGFPASPCIFQNYVMTQKLEPNEVTEL